MSMTVRLGELQPGDVVCDTGEVVREVRRLGGHDVVIVMTDGTTVAGDDEDVEEVTRGGHS